MKRILFYTLLSGFMLLSACGSQERHVKKTAKHKKTGKVDSGCHCEVWN